MHKIFLIVCVILCCFCDIQSVNAYNPECFFDVSSDYADDTRLLKELSIISGYEDGTFRGNELVTRAEFVTLVFNILIDKPYRSTENNISYFSDVTADDWFYSAVEVCVNRKIISGYGDGTFRPRNHINVKEADIICTNLLGYGVVANKNGYDSVIERIGIYNVGKADDECITRYDAVRILADSLDTEIFPEIVGVWDYKTYCETILDGKDILKVYDAAVSYEDSKYIISGTYRIPLSRKTDVFKYYFDENLRQFEEKLVTAYVKYDGENYSLIHLRFQ